jgi:hypothetical protein
MRTENTMVLLVLVVALIAFLGGLQLGVSL